ncbi:MAG: phosphotransferase, partial [Gemmatimonadota bacterium]|nr:phosphotransferase [Gemmatimonadota bacterium]
MSRAAAASPGLLERQLASLLGQPIHALDRRGSPYRSSHPLEEVDAVLASGETARLVLKASGPSAPGVRSVRPRLVRDHGREAWAYASLLDAGALGTPRYYGSVEGGNGTLLVLERVEGSELYQVGEREAWRAASTWLAGFHAWGRDAVESAGVDRRLLRQDARLLRRWWQRARRRAACSGPSERLEILEDLEDIWPRAVRRLSRLPGTLVHGEFYPSNILLERRGAAWSVRPVDWESVGVGPFALDLAALVTGDWSEAETDDFVRTYEGAAPDPPCAGDDLRIALHAARLVNAVQWLGWRASWTPPDEHARDWGAEAARAA